MPFTETPDGYVIDKKGKLVDIAPQGATHKPSPIDWSRVIFPSAKRKKPYAHNKANIPALTKPKKGSKP